MQLCHLLLIDQRRMVILGPAQNEMCNVFVQAGALPRCASATAWFRRFPSRASSAAVRKSALGTGKRTVPSPRLRRKVAIGRHAALAAALSIASSSKFARTLKIFNRGCVVGGLPARPILRRIIPIWHEFFPSRRPTESIRFGAQGASKHGWLPSPLSFFSFAISWQ